MREKDSPPSSEYINYVNSQAVWLGGFFEVGSTIGIGLKHTSRSESYGSPHVKVFDNNKLKVETFWRKFKGFMHPRGHSWEVAIYAPRASVITSAIIPFAPTRKEIAQVIAQWESMSADEHRDQAQRFSRRGRFFHSYTAKHFNELVDNPDFTAGVVDNRGIILHFEGKSGYIVRIHSRNIPLLEALQGRFGGEVKEDTSNKERSARFFRIDPSLYKAGKLLSLGVRESRDLLRFINGHNLLISLNFLDRAIQPRQQVSA